MERYSVWTDEPMYVYDIDKDIFNYPPVIYNEILPWSFNISHRRLDKAALQMNWKIYRSIIKVS